MYDIKGKQVALTGKFTQMARKEAAAELEKLGAVVGSMTKSTEILIYGEKAGSKLAKAQKMGIEVYNEDWLVALLSGEEHGAAALSGPLADYMERVEALVKRLEADPNKRVSYYRAPGVSKATLEKSAKSWGVKAWSDAISNLYQQANGFQLSWIDVTDSSYDEGDIERLPPNNSHPTMMQMENHRGDYGGAMWILPIEEAFKSSSDWSFESSYTLRPLDMGSNYYPVCLNPAHGNSSPGVIIGDDYGVVWESFYTVESYLEEKLKNDVKPLSA